MAQWQRKVKKWVRRYPDLVAEALRDEMPFLVGDVQRTHLSGPSTTNTTLMRQTGQLARSIHGTVNRLGKRVKATLGTNLVYAPTHEYGATIKAKNAPYLKFKIGNQWVSTKQVKIPARPFLYPTVQRNRLRIFDAIRERIVRGYQRAG